MTSETIVLCGIMNGMLSGDRLELGEDEFLDTRHYEPGDDIRTIDWRQSARNQRLVIRRYRDETAADWFICIDCSASVEWGGRKWPATVSLATALAYTFLYAGHLLFD